MRLHHISIRVSDLGRAVAFYEGVLGLGQVERPELGYPGAWFELGAGQQLHLLCLPGPVLAGEGPVGQDHHFALAVDDLADLQARLEVAGIRVVRSRSGRAAIFCRDPDGNGIECLQAPRGDGP